MRQNAILRIWSAVWRGALLFASTWCLSHMCWGQDSGHGQTEGQRIPGIASGRLQIVNLPGTLYAGTANGIPISLGGYSAQKAYVSLEYYSQNGDLLPPEDYGTTVIRHHPDGTAYLDVSPTRAGKAHLEISVTFTDGNRDTASVDCSIEITSNAPSDFFINVSGRFDRGRTGTMYMDLTKSFTKRVLEPEAVFPDSTVPVVLTPKGVVFRVIANDEMPAVSFDESSGTVSALHVGHALVIAEFRGRSVLTCIDVVGNARATGESTTCNELVPSGMTPPESSPADGTGLKMVRIPHGL